MWLVLQRSYLRKYRRQLMDYSQINQIRAILDHFLSLAVQKDQVVVWVTSQFLLRVHPNLLALDFVELQKDLLVSPFTVRKQKMVNSINYKQKALNLCHLRAVTLLCSPNFSDLFISTYSLRLEWRCMRCVLARRLMIWS